jgi:hypothetical protein
MGGEGNMSQRTFIEINHDHLSKIIDDPQQFVAVLYDSIRAKRQRNVFDMSSFWGVRLIGERHHSTPYKLEIGGEIVAEEK